MNRKSILSAGKCAAFICLISAMALQGPAALAADGDAKQLVPGGFTAGITMESDGVIVTGLSDPESGACPAGDAGILPGDVITMLGSCEIHCAEDMKKAVESLDGSEIAVKVDRGGKTLQFSVTPCLGEDGSYSFGMWLRDGLAGIGTVTYYDPDTGTFGALGHAVNDVDTGIIVPFRSGELVRSSVSDVVKGTCGAPGQLIGIFETGSVIGTLICNTESGIFGSMQDLPVEETGALPIASADEIRTGPAVILTNIAGTEIAEYDVEITRVYPDRDSTRSMTIKVTDPELIDAVGGIVQGMSGSPIIQDGKLVGAVTHVLVNDPTKGYAISIENMLDAAA